MAIMEKVTSVEVRVNQPGSFSDWHVGPQRQYIINLTGGGQLTGAVILCDRRFGRVFGYHNGAKSYCAARGFRGIVRV